jgi:hypothetical protein
MLIRKSIIICYIFIIKRPRSMVVNKNHPTTASMTSPSSPSPSAGTLPKNQSASVLISNTNNNNNLISNNETNGFNFSTYDINQKQNSKSINSETNDDSNNQENNLQNISENQTPIKAENSTGIIILKIMLPIYQNLHNF